MEAIQELLKIALLGTEKVNTEQAFALLPAQIQEKLSQLSADDREEAFLQLSSFVLPYYQAGKGFPKLESKAEAAKEENAKHASEKTSNLLGILLSESRTMLVPEWLRHCARRSQLVAPQFLPQSVFKF